jgi:hypothetical protein
MNVNVDSQIKEEDVSTMTETECKPMYKSRNSKHWQWPPESRGKAWKEQIW